PRRSGTPAAEGRRRIDVEPATVVRPEAGQDGGVLGSWLVQMLLVLAVLALVGYEAVSMGLTSFGVDDASRQVARAARDAYRSSDGSLGTAEQTAVEAAEVHDAEVVDVSIEGEDLTVTLSRRAPTLLLHRFAATA